MSRTLGIDLGSVRVGIAVADETGTIASPLTVLKRDPALLTQLLKLAQEQEATSFVVGLPLDMKGTRGIAATAAEAFVEELHEFSGMQVYSWDERLTTAAAEKALLSQDMSRSKRRQLIDAVAASILLQSWLDYQKRPQR